MNFIRKLIDGAEQRVADKIVSLIIEKSDETISEAEVYTWKNDDIIYLSKTITKLWDLALTRLGNEVREKTLLRMLDANQQKIEKMKNEIEDQINSEAFIDDIVDRVNRKQLKR